MRVCVLAGGTGGALLAAGFQRALPPGHLSVITNTGDDLDQWGLRVSPDTDSVLYRLAGTFNQEAGFGVEGETFAALGMLERYGEPVWFQIGDRDLATHVLRGVMLKRGLRLSEATAELCRRLGVPSQVIPMTDERVETWFETDAGRLSFQEYFVRERCGPRLRKVEFVGLDSARPSPEATRAVKEADLVVIGPSNPVISLAPILALLGSAISRRRCLAVTPLVGGRALKGPTAEMLRDLGQEVSAGAVGAALSPYASLFVLDQADRSEAGVLEASGLRVLVADTVMSDAAGAERLARAILEFTAGERALEREIG